MVVVGDAGGVERVAVALQTVARIGEAQRSGDVRDAAVAVPEQVLGGQASAGLSGQADAFGSDPRGFRGSAG